VIVATDCFHSGGNVDVGYDLKIAPCAPGHTARFARGDFGGVE
jgi:hypothetical protein